MSHLNTHNSGGVNLGFYIPGSISNKCNQDSFYWLTNNHFNNCNGNTVISIGTSILGTHLKWQHLLSMWQESRMKFNSIKFLYNTSASITFLEFIINDHICCQYDRMLNWFEWKFCCDSKSCLNNSVCSQKIWKMIYKTALTLKQYIVMN